MTRTGRPPTGVKVQVRIPAATLARLDREAERTNVTRAALLREALEDWVAEHLGPDGEQS